MHNVYLPEDCLVRGFVENGGFQFLVFLQDREWLFETAMHLKQ